MEMGGGQQRQIELDFVCSYILILHGQSGSAVGECERVCLPPRLILLIFLLLAVWRGCRRARGRRGDSRCGLCVLLH